MANVIPFFRNGSRPPRSGLDRAPRVCVVDDDMVSRRTVREALRDCGPGYEIDEYESAEELLHAGRMDDVALFVTEYHLPGLDGAGFVRRLATGERQTPILMLTADSSAEVTREALAEGVHDVVHKPLELYELHARLRNLLALKRGEKRQPSRAGVRVAVVEDDRVSALMIGEALRTAVVGYMGVPLDVRTFEEPTQAQIYLQGHDDMCDLLITDHHLGSASGLALVKAIRSEPCTRDLPVLFVTSDMDNALRWDALGAGITQFVQKPLDIDLLALRLRNLLTLTRAV